MGKLWWKGHTQYWEEDYPEGFTINFKAKDLGELASLEYELIESMLSNEKIVSKPSLTVKFGEEAIIEIDNQEVSKFAYLIKATPTKSINPTQKNIWCKRSKIKYYLSALK